MNVCFTKKELKKKKNQKDFRIENITKRKVDKLYLKSKGYQISYSRCVDKNDILKMSEYFSKHKSWGANVKVEAISRKVPTKDLINRQIW